MALELNVDGRRVFAATGGKPFDAELPVVVFLHGAGMNRTVWALPARYFANHGYAVMALDLPAHGNSDGPPLPSIGELADWLVRVLDAAGVVSATLVGHSMGTLPLLETSARHPERVDRIVLLGMSLPMAVSGGLLDCASVDDPAAYDMVNLWGHSKRAQLGGGRAAGTWVTGAGLRLLERSGPGVLYNDMNSCNEYQTGLEAARGITCPAVLILGDSDRMTPARNTDALLQALPKGRRIVLKGCGHMMLGEQPDETLDALIDATRRTP